MATPSSPKQSVAKSSKASPLQDAKPGTAVSPSRKQNSADIKPSPKFLNQLMRDRYNKSPLGHLTSSLAPSCTSTPRGRSGSCVGQDIYEKKLRQLKQVIKDAVFVNGAVCDEVLRTEEKLAKAKEERRFLLRKLLQYQSLNEPGAPSVKSESQGVASRQQKASGGPSGPQPSELAAPEVPGKLTKSVKRKMPSTAVAGSVSPTAAVASTPSAGSTSHSEAKKKPRQTAEGILDSLQVRPKKSKGVNRKVIPPLLLDTLGRPVFPMALGDITLHSIGEIVPDRLSFHSTESIYPAGYCITRVYASLHKLDSKCLYTCKISDSNDGPLFEIAAEDSSDIVFKATSPGECHSLMLRAVNKARGEILSTETRGLDFFGLSHPVIQNLVQSCPGSRKCSHYKWIKFEINKTETNDNVAVGTTDPAVSYQAFKSLLVAIGQKRPSLPTLAEQSTSLRSLLTKGNSQASSS